MKKRLFSALLALCMVLAMLPVPAFAAESSASAKGGDATFTLSASSASCADGHTGELGQLEITNVDMSKWESERTVTIQYRLQFRCTDPGCALYSDSTYFDCSQTHTITDTARKLCHQKISESFTVTIPMTNSQENTKNVTFNLTLASDKGISQVVRHDYDAASACTQWYYSTRCWECMGCGSFFTREDCPDEYKADKDKLYFPPAGHDLTNVPAKDPTCIARGTVEHWHCERCGLNFSDEEGQNQLTAIETDAPLTAHRYDTDGACTVCGAKAAAGVRTDTGMVWYDAMAGALAALTPGAELTVNGDYADAIALDKTCTVTVKAGVRVSAIQVSDAEGCVVTVSNDGSIGSLTGYTGKVALRSGSGVYGSIVNGTPGGTVGGFLSRNACYKTADGQWLHPDQATESSIQNVTVAYVPLAFVTISGENVTGSDGSYALTAQSGDSVTLTAAANTDGGSSEAASYSWYYENDPDTPLSQAAELRLENVSAGKRTIVCKAAVDGYTLTAKLALTVTGTKESQTITLKLSKTSVGIREKVLPFLSAEGVQEEAAVTYYQMSGETPDPENDAVIGEDFAFTEPGECKIYAYTAETDNYAATASEPVSVTVTAHADHCYCGGILGHTHEEAEWQPWDGKSAINYEWKWIPISDTGKLAFKVAYVYLTGNVSANLTLGSRQILYLCLNGYSFTCADPSQPAITLTGEKGWPAELDLCDCVGTGTLGGSNAGGGSIRIGAYANATLYSGTLTGNSTTENGGAVSVGDNGGFTMQGGAITGNSAANGGGIYANAGSVTINGGVISNNRAANGGGIYAASGAQFHLNGGGIQNNVATEEGGGVYCSRLYSQNTGRCEFYGGTISGNTAQRGGGAYVRVCFIGYRNCRVTGNTATEAGGGLYLVPFASEKKIYMGSVYGSGGTIAPYIYDNTVNSAQNNLYLSDPDTQIQFTARIDTGAKIGVYFTGITGNGASVLLNSLHVSTESMAEQYRARIFCDNPYYGRLEARSDGSYYDLYLLSTMPSFTVTFDPNGGTLNPDEESKSVSYNEPYGTLPTPVWSGHRFDGWFTEKDGGTKVEETTVMSSQANHTLYAHWTLLHTHCVCGGDMAAGDHTVHTSQVFTAWNGTDAISYTDNTAYVYLAQNATISSNLVVDGRTLYLCLNGNTFASNGSNKITVNNGGRLVLCDCAGGGTIKGATSGWGGAGIYLYKSTLDIFGGTITGGKITGKGGGGAIALDDSKCVLNIYGGAISGNNGKNSGGAIFLNGKDGVGGTVNMYGGTIANNTATNGGVLYSACGGTFNLYGGTISGNTANNGGVVYATSGGTFNLSGGTISGNKATNGDGGVINMAGGTLTISGANLTGNTASRYGGAIYLYNGVTATMTGGSITGNKANSEGGAVHVYGTSTFNLSGGSITGNSSVDGGAVYLNREPSVLNMTGGEILNNTATGNGGGVYIYRSGSVCNLSGGTISGNTANCGGGIYINPSNSGQLRLSGAPVVTGNTVSGAANNVYVPAGKTLTIADTMTDGGRIGVTTEDKSYPVAFSNAYGSNYEDRFFSDAADAHVEYWEDQMLYLVSGAYVEKYTVTVVAEGSGIASASPGRAPEDTEITLTAAPAEGSHFSGWRTDHPDAAVNDNKFTMPAGNVTVTAIFEVHSFTEEAAEERYLVSPADCDHDAVYYKSCVCGEKGTETFTKANSALDHDWGTWTSNGNDTHSRVCKRNAAHTETESCTGGAATCTAKAVCQVCGGEYGELAAHAFTAEVTEERYLKSAATCTEKAVYYKSCGVCGLSSKGTAGEATFESGSLLDHDWGEPDYTWTQVPDGYMCAAVKECTKCSHDVSEIARVVYAVTKEPTCLDAGTGTYTATFSDAFGFTTQTKDAAIPAAGHSWGAAEYTWAQTETGYTCTARRVCRKDEAHTETETVTAEYTVVTEPTCLTAGLGRCQASFEADWAKDASQDVPIPAAGHDWGNWTQDSDGKTHTRVCKRNGEHTETGNCAGGTATCVAKAVCETCKAEYGEKDPNNHAAGCAPQWTITEAEHSQKYSRCGKVTVAKAPHAFGPWTTTQEPAPEQTGEKERVCEVCEYRQTEIIPATGYAYYTIRATAYTGGSISPSGDVSVREGLDRTFTITPNRGYSVSNIKIDGKNVGTARSYTFENVTENHTIEVSFQKTTGSPQTGDGINLPLLCVLLTVSALGLAGMAFFRRRRAK